MHVDLMIPFDNKEELRSDYTSHKDVGHYMNLSIIYSRVDNLK